MKRGFEFGIGFHFSVSSEGIVFNKVLLVQESPELIDNLGGDLMTALFHEKENWNSKVVGFCGLPLPHSEIPAYLRSIVEDCGLVLVDHAPYYGL